MICHLLLFMKLFSKKLPYLFYAIKEGGGRKIYDLEDNEMQLVRIEIGYIFLEDMRKIHLYCVLSLNTDL